MSDESAQEQVTRFEAMLTPLLETAYGVAYRLTRNREEAEEVVQDTAIQAFRAFHLFEPGTNFKAWFFKIMLNCFRGRRRKQRRTPDVAPLVDVSELYLYVQTARAGLHTANSSPAEVVISRMNEAQIEQAIVALPEEYRLVCVLYFMEQVSYREIADLVGCPVGTVRSRLHRARKLLQKALWELVDGQWMDDKPVSAAERESGG